MTRKEIHAILKGMLEIEMCRVNKPTKLILSFFILVVFTFNATTGTGASGKPIAGPHASGNFTYYFPYYDSITTANADWLLVWNTTATATSVTVAIGGASNAR